MVELFGSPVNAALLNVFFLTDRNKKDTGLDRDDVEPSKLNSVGVIGAGIMGAGIAAANIKRKVPVVITAFLTKPLHCVNIETTGFGGFFQCQIFLRHVSVRSGIEMRL